MPAFRNTYRKLDMDTAYNKYDSDSYCECRNMRIISNEANRTGALTSANGNTYRLDITSSGIYIIGSVKIRNGIIFFATDNDSTSPGSATSYIYKTIISGGSITSNTFLYIGPLGFSRQYPIEDAVSFYESEDVEKIYWTDNYHNLRYANIANPLTEDGTYSSSFIDANKFEIVQDYLLSAPVISSLTSGNIPNGMVQYSYRLFNLYGSVTNFSVPSIMIPITGSSLSSINTLSFRGSDSVDNDGNALSSGKGVNISISYTDYDFNRIEVVAIHYDTLNGTPKIYKIGTYEISSTETLQITDDGSYNNGEYTLEEFTLINNSFRCKSIDTKNNILFASNVVEEEFDFDFDARAYRWTMGSYCRLYQSDGSYWYNSPSLGDQFIHYSSGGVAIETIANMSLLPKDIDAINAGHDIANAGGAGIPSATTIYNRQKNGSTIGGQGPNVSYIFEANTDYGSYKYIDALYDSSGAREEITFGGKSRSAPNYYDSLEAPVANQKTRTFCRSEIYRVGLIGIDTKGRSSPVKWIGDLQMPNCLSHNPVTDNGVNAEAVPIQIKFTISNLPSEVEYVKIVYVKRKENDKTVKFQGIVNVAYYQHYYHISSPYHASVGTYNGISNAYPYIKRHIALFSPEISFNKDFNQGSDDYIQMVAHMEGYYHNNDSYISSPYFHSLKLKKPTYVDPKMIKVSDARLYETTINPDEEQNEMTNFGVLSSLQFYPRIVKYNSSTQCVGNLGTCALVYLTANIDTAGMNTANYMVVNYRTNLYGSQYGGHTYEARSRNEYISAGDIYKVSSGSVTAYARHGDTYINYADILTGYYNKYYADTSGHSWLGSVEMFPCETTINLAYRLDDCWHRVCKNIGAIYIREKGNASFTAGTTSYDYGWTDLNLENTVYRRLADAKKYYAAPLDYNAVIINDSLIKASDIKEGNELIDPWTTWINNETITVNKKYGQVNKIRSWKNFFLFWQDDAVGALSVLDRSVISDQAGRSTTLGEGGVLQRYDYISTNSGLSTRFSVAESLSGIYWYDHKRKNIFRFLNNIEDITTVKGVNSYLSSISSDYSSYDNVVSASKSGKGFYMSYNPYYNEIWFTVKTSLITGTNLVFNEVIDSYTGFLDTKAQTFVNYGNNLYSLYDNKIYTENIGYPGHFHGTYYDSYITVISVPIPNIITTLTNLEISSEVYNSYGIHIHTKTIDKITIWNDYQNTGIVNVSSANTRRLLRTWRHTVGRNSIDTARIRDTYAKIRLTITNSSSNYSYVLHDLVSLYMVPIEGIANKIQQK